tara:strand:+ start:944 stop:2173 length:1230 start_codon:yes stop_codon:yes gene_type:complete
MQFKDPIGIIELGNLNIKCVIFKISHDEVELLSTFSTPSDGIHNDTITNLPKASKTIRSCIGGAEKKAKVSLKKINLVFEQPDFLCTKFSKNKKIDGSKIHKEDIEFLLKEGKKQLTLNDKRQTIIHIFNHNYVVDGKKFLEEPIGVFADSFSHEITFVTVPKNNIKNINQVFNDCDIEIERFISRTFSLGAKLLQDKELETGSGIIDLGFEKISFGIFKNFALVHSLTFPIGINHITKDISKVCSLSLEESEKIRNDIDFSFVDNKKLFNEENHLKNIYFINSNYRKISKNLILNVVKSRLDEIFEILKKQLTISGFNKNSVINILLTGGGSNLLNIEKNFANFFDPKTRNINKTKPDLENTFQHKFTACLGALKIIKEGWETEAIPEAGRKNIEKLGFFSRFFGVNK